MILRDRCSTPCDLASLQEEWKKTQNALVRGRQLCSQQSIFEEVSQNCFVFDVVKFKNGGSLADLLLF